VVLDQQHGAIETGDLIGLLQAVQPFVPALVRLPSVEPAAATRALDLGADGVVVPLVDSVDDARRAVAAALYPPAGARSYGPLRAAVRHGPGYRERVAEHALVIAMIETANALASVEAIAAVPASAGCSSVRPTWVWPSGWAHRPTATTRPTSPPGAGWWRPPTPTDSASACTGSTPARSGRRWPTASTGWWSRAT
jgi:hypothetical protein